MGIIQAQMLLRYRYAGLRQPGTTTWALGCMPQASPHGPCIKILPGFNVLAAYQGQLARRYPLMGAEILLQSVKII